MKFLVVKTLCFQILFCQVHSLTKSVRGQTLIVKNLNNILELFFVDLLKHYVEKSEPRHITIVGASANDRSKAQSLLNFYPYIMCTNMEKCAFLERFSERTLVIVFLNKFSEKKFRKNVDILSRCQTCHVLFVSSTIMPVNNIRSIFIWAHEHNMPYTEFAQLAKDVVELYSRFVTKNCSTEARLTRVWRPGMDLGQMNTWAFKLNDLNGCPVSVSSLTFTPKMMIRESENGSLIIVGGREGKLLLTLADKLNFTIALRHPSMADRMKYSRKVAIINDVINGITEIGIGRLRPTNEMQNRIAVSAAYDDECITWGVPRVLSWKDDIVFMEFSGTVWAAVGVAFVASWVLGYVHRNIVLSENVKRKHVGFFKVLFDALTLHLGNPINHVSFSTGGRCVLIIYLYYAMVITTAYKASLASILATDGGSSVIVDVDGIIKANLTVIGSLYDYKILKDQENDSVITQRLIERFVVDNNDSAIWDQLTRVDNNYAFLARRSALNWLRQTIAKTQESVTFDVFNNCVLAYHPVVALQKKSVLRKSVNTVIQRLTESGILNHWDPDEHDSERILKRRGAQMYFEIRAIYKFQYLFLVYTTCIWVCCLVFVIEILIWKFKSMNQLRN